MAERSILSLSAFLFLQFFISIAITDQKDLIKPFSPSMVLPLILEKPNSTRIQNSFRRQLKNHPNANMRLYDDLLSNGYYTTRLFIGSPPQKFALIVDTGSTVTYVPCSTCELCGKHQDPKFQPDMSDTYKPVKCSLDCTCDNDNSQCTYERQYAEMSSSSGVLGDDLISFGNESALEPQRAVFGCENEETGDLYSQRADGIMGLGRGRLSIMDQLVDKGVISDSFSLCYGGMGIGGGAMILGGISPPPGMVFSHSDPVRSPYYNIELKGIHVAGKPLKINPRIFDAKHGTVLDSGTTYAYLPEAAFVAFKEAISKNLSHLKKIGGPDPNYNDVCFSAVGSDPSDLSKTFPMVDMVFGNGQKLSLAPENYLFRHSKIRGAYCLGIFHNGKDPTTLLGGIIVRNTLVTYDRANERVGFLKTNCSELWETLHIANPPASPPTAPPASPPTAPPASPPTAPPTSPPSNYIKNSTLGDPPSIAPSGLPSFTAPGDFRIGFITFDMSLSVSYSDLKPHITELEDFISHELEVDASQVRLLNFTGRGNESLLRWTILPAKPDHYFSNTSAMKMFDRLANHSLQLPPHFGRYDLLQWKAEPTPKQSWWGQHLLAVILGGVVMLALCLTTIGIWYAWRQREQEIGKYKPVGGAVVAEQELQHLTINE